MKKVIEHGIEFDEMRIAKEFLERAEAEIGELPTTVKMIAVSNTVRFLKKVESGYSLKVHISNPKTNKLYRETISIF